MRSLPRRAIGAFGAAALLATLAAAPAGAATLTGTVTAADEPVAAIGVALYAGTATTTVPLGRTTSGDDGSWSLDYELPAGSGVLYAVAAGGEGLPPTFRLMAATPTTSGAIPGTLPISEQTTVAAGYALNRFFDERMAIHGPAPGLQNAAATVTNLVEPATAKVSFTLAGAPNGNATPTLATFNTIAGMITRCWDGGPGDCARILRAATPPGGARPTDTLQLVRALASHPSLNLERLYALGDQDAFTPQLDAAPQSWLLPIVFVGSGLNAPGRMAFDSAGTVWAGNNFQGQGTTAGLTVTHLDAAGQPLPGSPFTGGGITAPGFGTTIDAQDRIWIGNYTAGSISLLNPDGTPAPGSPFTQGPVKNPQGIAIDGQGNVWIASFGTSSVVVYPQGDPTRAVSISGGGLDRPFSVQIDGAGAAWVSNQSIAPEAGSVVKINPDFTIAGPPITGGGLRSPMGLAIDSVGNAWIANLFSTAVTQISPAGAVTAHRQRGTRGGWSTAIDGDDRVWVAGFFPQNVSLLCGARTAACPPGTKTGEPISPRRTGWTSPAFQHITAVQVDASGNVWLANNWSNGSPVKDFVGGNGLVKLPGAAAPVKTPLIGVPQRP